MRRINKVTLFFWAAVLSCVNAFSREKPKHTRPNVIFILADDLGIGDLGCYGQRVIKTPAINKLAQQGMKFTNHYSGSTVSAPSRCALITGKHTGHSYIRGNKEHYGADGRVYDTDLPSSEVTVAEVFKQADYKTACCGKWGLGSPDNEGHPNKQGFDYFYGYLGQLNAHTYYPDQLFENNKPIILSHNTYSHDLIMDKALSFIKDNSSEPFFLYLTPTIPHADLDVPDDDFTQYNDKFYETPYAPKVGYKQQAKPRATFAKMVSRLDRDVAKIMSLLEELGIADNTIVIFTSDNGTHTEGGHDPYYFDSNGPFRGVKRDLYEGGIRTPFIVRWGNVISPGTVSYHISTFWDFMPTVCDLIGEDTPQCTDGISYLPTLTNKGRQKKHDYLYFEFHERGGCQAVIREGWKLIRLNVNNPKKERHELYNLTNDPSEIANSINQHPKKAAQLKSILDKARTNNPIFNFGI